MDEHLQFLTASTTFLGVDFQNWVLLVITGAVIVLLVVLPDIFRNYTAASVGGLFQFEQTGDV